MSGHAQSNEAIIFKITGDSGTYAESDNKSGVWYEWCLIGSFTIEQILRSPLMVHSESDSEKRVEMNHKDAIGMLKLISLQLVCIAVLVGVKFA